MLVRGFVTDIHQPGVELPIITVPRQELMVVNKPVTVDPNLADAYSLHEIKGWSRACAMNVAVMAINALGVMDDYKAFLGPKITNFQTQQANFLGALPEGKDEIDINRGRIDFCNLNSTCGFQPLT